MVKLTATTRDPELSMVIANRGPQSGRRGCRQEGSLKETGREFSRAGDWRDLDCRCSGYSQQPGMREILLSSEITALWLVLIFNYLMVLRLFIFSVAGGYMVRRDRELWKERDEIRKVLEYQEILDAPERYNARVIDYVRKKGVFDRLKVQNRFKWLSGHYCRRCSSTPI